jgi:hypothetical protein
VLSFAGSNASFQGLYADDTPLPAVALRAKAIDVLLAITAGAYQTSLLTYLIQRDLFPSVMKVGRLPVCPLTKHPR